jgi:hypothetical protein
MCLADSGWRDLLALQALRLEIRCDIPQLLSRLLSRLNAGQPVVDLIEIRVGVNPPVRISASQILLFRLSSFEH